MKHPKETALEKLPASGCPQALRRWAGQFLARIFHARQGGTLLFLLLFVSVATLTRLGLFLRCADAVAWDWTLPAGFLTGFLFDGAMALFFALPLSGLLALAPGAWFAKKTFLWLLHCFFVSALGLLLFGAVAEWLFWSEFSVRFNFIAVDYLIYTHEVVANIRESYNLPLILSGIGMATLMLYVGFLRTGLLQRWLARTAQRPGPRRSVLWILAPNALAFCWVLLLGYRDIQARPTFLEALSQGLRHMGAFQPAFPNSFNAELAKNGEFALLAAFWSNELRYDDFYRQRPRPEAFARLRELVSQDNSAFLSPGGQSIARRITADAPARRLNVVQITVESLSAEFLGCYGQAPYAAMGLTPNLDQLAKESLWFRNFYASGTRTVRGIEALVLSIPPVPGQSVLRRPNNENLFSLGSVFQASGYDTAFIYGGNGFFDNMNYFFANNGFRVVDKPAKIAADHPPITFENAWGVSDEDLLDWVLTEADRAHAQQRNFYHFVVTTSNHRPYTWPEGRIDIPSGTGSRVGAVKYTDYAIGRFLRAAREKPWFKDTVFVVVADHCASVAGKQELEVRKYEVPLFIYAPGILQPQTIDTLCGQIDYAPTLLGLLNWDYDSRFFGRDVLRPSSAAPRAFVSNYQKIALLEERTLSVLKPVDTVDQFACDRATGRLLPAPANSQHVNDTITYYQCASDLLAQGRQRKNFPHNHLALDVADRARPAAAGIRADTR